MRRHKYSAIRTEHDGFKFDSKKEGRYYQELKLRVNAGEVVFFLMQVPFHLPGNVKYVVDFQEFHADGTTHFVDVKGMITDTFKMKKKMVENLYPVVIEIA